MSRPHEDFLTANAGVIETIATDAGQILDASRTAVVVENDGVHGDAVITEGMFTADDFMMHHSEFPEEVAREISEHESASRNRVLRQTASMRFTALIAIASMTDAVERYDAGQVTPEEALAESLLSYGHGTFRSTQLLARGNTHLLELSRVKLDDVDVYGTAEEIRIELTDELGLSRQLSIARLGSVVRMINYDSQLESDPLVLRCAGVLKEDITRILPIIGGRHEDEDELDNLIAGIWMSYQGTSMEQEVTSLLDEVRDRAVAVKESTALAVQHQTSMPSVDQMSEFAALVGEDR